MPGLQPGLERMVGSMLRRPAPKLLFSHAPSQEGHAL